MTATALLETLTTEGVNPTVEGGELVLPADPPDRLAEPLAVLHTGIAALLMGRTWWGCDGITGRSFALDPRQRIPSNVTLLGVGGEPGWDRVSPIARLKLPHLFAMPVKEKGGER